MIGDTDPGMNGEDILLAALVCVAAILLGIALAIIFTNLFRAAVGS